MYAGPQPKRSQRPFQKSLVAQHEKNKRDRNLRERLEKERKQEQHRIDKREEYLSKAMNTRRQYTPAQRQHRMKKSGSAAFFQQLMRPISNAFALDHVDINTPRRTAAELDFTPTGKPALVLSVVDARILHSVNYERSYTFQLDTEDGGHYLLQAATKLEMTQWIRTIDHVSKTAAKRRLTYIGNSPKPQLADHIHDHPTTASRDPTAGKLSFFTYHDPLLTMAYSVWCRSRIFTSTRGRRFCGSTRSYSIIPGEQSSGGRSKRIDRSWHL